MCASKVDQMKGRRRVERNIAFDEKRGLYYVTLHFGKDPETKKQIKKTETFKKLAQARAALRKHETARDVGQVVMPTQQTLHQWFGDWMQSVAELNLADTTIYGYKQMFYNHIDPVLGNMPLQKLTPQQLQRYYAEKIRAGELSSNTVRKHHDLLNTVLRAAVF